MTADLIYLTRADVKSLLPDWHAQIDVVEQTYVDMSEGSVEMPPKPGIHPRKDAFIHAMPAFLARSDVAALKWVSGYPSNKELGIPYINGLLILNDAATGVPTAVMDCVEITAARTAAASGVCVRRWAPQNWTRAAILGCGEQGNYHADMLRALNPAAEIIAYDPSPERADALRGRTETADSVEAAVADADIVISAAPIVKSPAPSIFPGMLKAQHLLLPIDFDAVASKAIVDEAEIFLTDNMAQFEHYRAIGHFQGWRAPQASVGDRVRQAGDADRVVCCNLGVGALDAAFAAVVNAAAREQGLGLRLPR
jgi:ornithine cyclodeaminase/alanine dehydrogenase